MDGYGCLHIADDKTTVADMACSAANMLLEEMGVDKSEIDLLVFINLKLDFPEDVLDNKGRINYRIKHFGGEAET